MNQQDKIQCLIDYCGELEAEVCEARRWAIHLLFWYRRLKGRLILCHNTTRYYGNLVDRERQSYIELENENAELRAGLVFYAIENAKLIGTMRDADDAHGMTPGINRSNYCPRCGTNYPVQPDGSFLHTCSGSDL